MHGSSAISPTSPRTLGRSIQAIGAAFFANAALSLAVDQLLHVAEVDPPWGEPLHEPALNLLALS